MSAEVHSETELYRVESRPASKLIWIEKNRSCSHAPGARIPSAAPREKRPMGPWLQLNHLRRVNVLARANLAEQFLARGGVEIQHGERGTAGLIPTE